MPALASWREQLAPEPDVAVLSALLSKSLLIQVVQLSRSDKVWFVPLGPLLHAASMRESQP